MKVCLQLQVVLVLFAVASLTLLVMLFISLSLIYIVFVKYLCGEIVAYSLQHWEKVHIVMILVDMLIPMVCREEKRTLNRMEYGWH